MAVGFVNDEGSAVDVRITEVSASRHHGQVPGELK
jgi:hypothetical protein